MESSVVVEVASARARQGLSEGGRSRGGRAGGGGGGGGRARGRARGRGRERERERERGRARVVRHVAPDRRERVLPRSRSPARPWRSHRPSAASPSPESGRAREPEPRPSRGARGGRRGSSCGRHRRSPDVASSAPTIGLGSNGNTGSTEIRSAARRRGESESCAAPKHERRVAEQGLVTDRARSV